MPDAWNDRARAKEEEYFARLNQEAMARLKARVGQVERKSPITGDAMEQITSHGLVIDRCKKSGGVWFDQEEVSRAYTEIQNGNIEWLRGFFDSLLKKS